MYELSLNENDINFMTLEQSIFSLVCCQALNMIVNILEKIDDKLLEERDKSIYSAKDLRRHQ